MYARKYFNPNAKKLATDLVNSLRDEFMNILQGAQWMDTETSQAAIAKANSMLSLVGYPVEFSENAPLDQFYREMEIETDNLFSNWLKVRVFEKNYQMNRLRETINKTDWEDQLNVAHVNAFYHRHKNIIGNCQSLAISVAQWPYFFSLPVIPAAILQEPFFFADRPAYMNYGAIGQVIGHEITHGFDNAGHQFDANGNVADWLKPVAKRTFASNAQCIVDQYGNYRNTELNRTVRNKCQSIESDLSRNQRNVIVISIDFLF